MFLLTIRNLVVHNFTNVIHINAARLQNPSTSGITVLTQYN